ncbi:MAG: glycosyltransferase [Clostridiales bacterium]|nr:glycosyltransferase [Clostridiales bacterium]
MQDKPLISVLMGIYNCSSTLKEAVDSIMAQTYENWELIMCDDCSSDDTYSVALELAKRDSRIKVIKNEKNLTLAPTLNNCLKQARGEYIARMDGDDVCDPKRFELELDALIKNPDCVLVSCFMKIFDESGETGLVKYKEHPQKSDFSKGSPFCHAGCMMKTSVLRELGGYNTSPDVLRAEDFDLWVRLYEAGYTGMTIPYPLYSMRDDLNAYKRRKFSHRFIEYKIRRRAIRVFKLPKKYCIYAIKPVIVAFVPSFLYKILHKKRVNSK